MKRTLAFAALPVLFTLGLIVLATPPPPPQTSALQPQHVTVAVDDDDQPVAAWETSTGEPIPLQQLEQMMAGAVPPNIDNTARWMKGGMYVMPKPPGDGGQQPTASQLIGHIASCQCDEDFASIATGYWSINPNPCACPGIRLGDKCAVGVAQCTPADGGSCWYGGMELQAVARADNLLEIQVYNQLGDAGALNPPDAGYMATCFGPALN